MKIGIDASRAFMEQKTGIEEYSYQLIKHIKLMNLEAHQIFLYTRSEAKVDFDLPQNFFVKRINIKKLWTQIGLSLQIKKDKIDLLFIPSHTIPVIHPQKTIVTIHGLEYKYFPQGYSLKERILLELNTLIAIKWSSKIITPSENTKKDLIKFYKVNSEKIKVIHHGVDDDYQTSNIKYQNKKRSNILFIGRLEARKNLTNLVKAFELFKKIYKSQSTNHKLILVGKIGFGFEEIKKTIKESSEKNNIILKGFVSREEKNNLYKNAGVFVSLSFYEGFGLPILEAMSFGIPVICSNLSSFPEIASDAGLLVNPNSVEKIAEAMKRFFSNSNFKNNMIQKGFENVQKFSWEKSASETMEYVIN